MSVFTKSVIYIVPPFYKFVFLSIKMKDVPIDIIMQSWESHTVQLHIRSLGILRLQQQPIIINKAKYVFTHYCRIRYQNILENPNQYDNKNKIMHQITESKNRWRIKVSKENAFQRETTFSAVR